MVGTRLRWRSKSSSSRLSRSTASSRYSRKWSSGTAWFWSKRELLKFIAVLFIVCFVFFLMLSKLGLLRRSSAISLLIRSFSTKFHWCYVDFIMSDLSPHSDRSILLLIDTDADGFLLILLGDFLIIGLGTFRFRMLFFSRFSRSAITSRLLSVSIYYFFISCFLNFAFIGSLSSRTSSSSSFMRCIYFTLSAKLPPRRPSMVLYVPCRSTLWLFWWWKSLSLIHPWPVFEKSLYLSYSFLVALLFASSNSITFRFERTCMSPSSILSRSRLLHFFDFDSSS